MGSDVYNRAVLADLYFRKKNSAVAKRKTIAEKYLPEMTSFKPANSDFPEMLTYWVFRTLGGGLNIDQDKKKRLGNNFDFRYLIEGVIPAALGGVCYAYYQKDPLGEDKDNLIYVSAAQGFPLLDERTSNEKVFIRFWWANGDTDKPLCVELFEQGGITDYQETKDDKGKGKLGKLGEQRPYEIKVRDFPTGERQVTDVISRPELPIFPLYVNITKESEFTDNLLNNIDSQDAILFELIHAVLHDDGVYKYLFDYGGEEFIDALKLFDEKVIRTNSENARQSAVAEPVEAPFSGKIAAYELLTNEIRKSFSMPTVGDSAGVTATEIKDRNKYLDTKSGVLIERSRQFICGIFEYLDVEHEDEEIQFDGRDELNATEIVNKIDTRLSGGWIDVEQAIDMDTEIPRDDKEKLKQRLAIEAQEAAKDEFEMEEDGALEPTAGEVEGEVEQQTGKQLNGAQTQSLIAIMGQYAAETITLGQAVNLVAVAIGISKEEARKIIEGIE